MRPAPIVQEIRSRTVDASDEQPRSSGFSRWFRCVEHRTLGIRYIVTACIFHMAAGIESGLVAPIFHPAVMLFLFAVPVIQGMGVSLVPMMIGARGVMFPRANAFGYYLYLAGGIILCAAFFFSGASAAWFKMLMLPMLSACVAAVTLIATILKMRAPGMSINRMSVFVWAMLIQSFLAMGVLPPVLVSGLLNPASEELIWLFGYPLACLIVIPAFGMISSVLSTFVRRKLYGYSAIVVSLLATGFMGLSLWTHPWLKPVLSPLGEVYATAAGGMIVVPGAILVACWIATVWGGKARLEPPLLFVAASIPVLALGGLAGVMIQCAPFNQLIRDVHFPGAYPYCMLACGAMFALLGAFCYWFPKFTGRLMSPRLSSASFWLLFAGFNLAFFAGFRPEELGNTNQVPIAGVLAVVFGVVLFAGNAIWSRWKGIAAGMNPWAGWTLEWAAEIPIVVSAYPLYPGEASGRTVEELGIGKNEVLITTMLDAAPCRSLVLHSRAAGREDLAKPSVVGIGYFMPLIGLGGGPCLWIAHQCASSFLLRWTDPLSLSKIVLHSVTVVSLALVAFSAGLSLRAWKRTLEEPTAESSARLTALHFLGKTGLLLNAFFFLAILALGIPFLFVGS